MIQFYSDEANVIIIRYIVRIVKQMNDFLAFHLGAIWIHKMSKRMCQNQVNQKGNGK